MLYQTTKAGPGARLRNFEKQAGPYFSFTGTLILPTLMPPFFSVNCRSWLPLNLPALVVLITLKMPRSTFLTPLVRTRAASLYWSLSTPMPQILWAAAAFRVPRPQPPARIRSRKCPGVPG